MKSNAVRYYIQATVSGERVTKMVYEHRDEPPESWNTWKDKKVPRYRRCYAGIVTNGLPLLRDVESGNKTFKNYKREFTESLKELSDIAYDISGNDAKRILKNIWRWVEQKQKELADE